MLLGWGAFDLSVCPMWCAATDRLAPMVCVERRPHFLPVQSLLIWLSPSHQGCRHHAVLGGWGWSFCLPSLLLGVGENNLFSILFPLSPNLSHHHP